MVFTFAGAKGLSVPVPTVKFRWSVGQTLARAARDFFKDLGASGAQNPKFSRARRGTRAQACGWGHLLATWRAPGGLGLLMRGSLNGGSRVYADRPTVV